MVVLAWHSNCWCWKRPTVSYCARIREYQRYGECYKPPMHIAEFSLPQIATKITHLGDASLIVAGICCGTETKTSLKEALCPSTVDYSQSLGGGCLPSTTSSLAGR